MSPADPDAAGSVGASDLPPPAVGPAARNAALRISSPVAAGPVRASRPAPGRRRIPLVTAMVACTVLLVLAMTLGVGRAKRESAWTRN
jgi:hypothetical protein